MESIKKAAALANGRSRACATCSLCRDKNNIRCTPEISMICSRAFREGFAKGVKWSKEQLKNKSKDYEK